ncbi:MAG: VOC family protein [Desertimonas sp.]
MLRFHQVNIVVPDLAAASHFLRSLGVDVPTLDAAWSAWEEHHLALPTADGFAADLDSSVFAARWGSLPSGFEGVVVNLRADDRAAVDATFTDALELGAEPVRDPYDSFWGARYAIVRGPGPIVVGIMSPTDPAMRGDGPDVADL